MIDPRFTSLANCQLLEPHNYPGVYFLRRGEEIVYVGQSKNIAYRIADHIGRKSFDSVLIMPVPEEALDAVEMHWIRRLELVLNRPTKIPLTQNQYAIVDAADYEWLAQWKWYATWSVKTQSFYAIRRNGKISFSMARVITAALPGLEVDHKNYDTLDNRRSNLRICTKSENGCNHHGLRSNNTSGYVGVRWVARRNKWYAEIAVNKRSYHLGSFDSPVAAAEARDKAAIRLHK
jgi:hypothetical protein